MSRREVEIQTPKAMFTGKSPRIKDLVVIRKRFRLQEKVPSAPTQDCAYANTEYMKGKEKLNEKKRFPYHTYCEKQKDAGSRISETWKSHKYMITLESIIPLISRF